ncbi:E3 ubiquitin-protein ligase TRIM58-like [Pogona vitticeps]
MKDKVNRQKEQIEGEFCKLHNFLEEEEYQLLKRLKKEEQETLKPLNGNLEQLFKQTSSLEELVTEVKKKSQQPKVELLKVSEALSLPYFPRNKSHLKLVEIEPVSTELRNVYRTPCTDIIEILSHFKIDTLEEWLEMLFETYLLVLSSETFTSGRHYWEVEVGDSKEWDVGVCRESVGQKGQAPIMSPASGFWRLWLRKGNQYKGLNSYPIPLPMNLKPTRVGVLLDYSEGEVSFYNVTEKTLIYTYIATFYTPLRAFFSPSRHLEGGEACPLSVQLHRVIPPEASQPSPKPQPVKIYLCSENTPLTGAPI